MALVVLCMSGAAVQAQSRTTSIQKGMNWLITKQDQQNGSYTKYLPQPAGTAIVEIAFLDSPSKYMGPFVTNGYKYISTHVQSKGGLYMKKYGYYSYNTSLALIAFLARGDKSDQGKVEAARKYLINMQFNAEDGPITIENQSVFGGWGYDFDTLAPDPDIITTYWACEALHRSGVKSDSNVWKDATVFIKRCTNEKFGGFKTAPEDSKSKLNATRRSSRILRPYGSATCAGVAGLLLCGNKADDNKVMNGVKWIAENFELHENPKLGHRERFLYYYLLARALELNGSNEISEPKGGESIPWAEKLSEYLIKIQKDNGSWENDKAIREAEKNWCPEASRELTSAYALMALSICERALVGKK